MTKDPYDLGGIQSILIGETSRKPRRDTRRAFSQTQKKEILYQQGNKCARCHKKLDPRAIQFDHAKPWASGGRTITQNGRALCGECHDIVTHSQRLKRVDKKRRTRKQTDLFQTPKIRLPKGYL